MSLHACKGFIHHQKYGLCSNLILVFLLILMSELFLLFYVDLYPSLIIPVISKLYLFLLILFSRIQFCSQVIDIAKINYLNFVNITFILFFCKVFLFVYFDCKHSVFLKLFEKFIYIELFYLHIDY